MKKDNDIVHNELARVRATRMEGPFGTQKEHYDLKRIKGHCPKFCVNGNRIQL